MNPVFAGTLDEARGTTAENVDGKFTPVMLSSIFITFCLWDYIRIRISYSTDRYASHLDTTHQAQNTVILLVLTNNILAHSRDSHLCHQKN